MPAEVRERAGAIGLLVRAVRACRARGRSAAGRWTFVALPTEEVGSGGPQADARAMHLQELSRQVAAGTYRVDPALVAEAILSRARSRDRVIRTARGEGLLSREVLASLTTVRRG